MEQIKDLILFIMSTTGLALIVTSSSLFAPLRKFLETKYGLNTKNRVWWFLYSISKCTLCFGLWGGLLIYFLLVNKIYFINYAFASSFVCYFFANYIDKLKKY